MFNTDKTWLFDQSESVQCLIDIIIKDNKTLISEQPMRILFVVSAFVDVL